MAKDETDWAQEEEDGNAELYVKLMPYILRDFMHKDDVKNTILAMQADPSGLISLLISDSEGLRAAQDYKAILDSGEELTERVKPVIKF
jgi:hypothetical protein